MSKSNIHPTAIVEPGAKLGERITIEPYAIVKAGVTLHDGVTVKSHAYLDGLTTIGENSVIYPGASIGTKTQDLKFKGERTYVKIGKNCEIREFCTINSSCGAETVVEIGDSCMIMAYCHVAHNCRVGNHVIMANSVNLAGYVTVEDHAIVGGCTAVHQFTRIGCYSMVGGLSRVTHDVPPYTVGGGIPYRLAGPNRVGLMRNGFSMDTRKALTRVFKLTYRSGMRLSEALSVIEKEVELLPEVRHWLEFCRTSKRGLIGLAGMEEEESESESDESPRTVAR